MAGPKRPLDPNQLAKLIVDIATGEVEDGEYWTDTATKGLPQKIELFARRAFQLAVKTNGYL